MKIILLLLLHILLLSASSNEKEFHKVSLQLAWLHQFQFAGYYMAKEKGYYRDLGLDVDLLEYASGMNVYNEVIEGNSEFGVGRSSMIRYDSSGKKIVMLAAIFQSSPDILITLQESGIERIEDFKGKFIMKTKEAIDNASINAMLRVHHLNIDELHFVEHTFNLKDLIEKNVDIYAAYISNEPYTLDRLGIKYRVFSPSDDGFDFYSDILFTSRDYLERNPHIVRKFRAASLQGWEYAFSHIEESVDVILQKYNTQNKSREALLYEAKVLKELAYKENSYLGEIDKNQLQRSYDIYKILGFTQEPLNTEKLIYDAHKSYFTLQEQEYLKQKATLNFCTQPDLLPYSAIKNGEFVGIASGVLNLIKRGTSLDFELVETKSMDESFEKIRQKRCDVIPMVEATKSRKKFLRFTSAYYEEPLVIVTKQEENYILNIGAVLDKRFALKESSPFIQKLKKDYPNIKLIEVKSIEEGFDYVARGEAFGYIDLLMSSAYYIQHHNIVGFKVARQLDESVKLRVGVRDDDEILFNIMQKGVESISKEDIEKIIKSWISLNYTKPIDIWYFKEFIIVILIFILFLLYREYFLKKENRELEQLQSKLLELNKTLEQKVYEATKDLQKAQEIAKLGSWVCQESRNGERKLRWSKETYDICEIDYSLQEGINAKFFTKVHPDDVEKVKDFYSKSLRNSKKSFIQHRLLMDDGRIKYVDEHSETFYDENGTRTSYGTIQDITQEVLLKQEMMKKDAFIIHQSRLAQMGEMMSMIAHQWKQPLSAIGATQMTISTAIELEKYDLSNEKEREAFLKFLKTRLDKIALYVHNLSDIIRDFRDFYKPKKESEYRSMDLIIKKSYELIGDTLESAGIDVALELHAATEIKVHENELMQVILNILNNAKEQLQNIKCEDGKIIIRSYEHDDEIFIEIEDNGGGIDATIIDKVFDPYFSTKLEKHGTGLGLYMSKIIISEYHHGDISVINTQTGARFTIKLKKVTKEI